MTIDNHGGQDDQMENFPGSPAEAHALLALEQSALYETRLAIARWINASAATPLQPAAVAAIAPRTAWYAQAQQNFQEWLARGGFGQYDVVPADLAAANPVAGSTIKAPTLFNIKSTGSCVDLK